MTGNRSLGALVRSWNAKGAPLPVAITVSILDDLLARADTPRVLDDVVIDERGFAQLAVPPSGRLDDLTAIVEEMLGDDVPPHARTLLARMTSDDPMERPADADQLRSWIRDTLGAPAAREEVVACVESSMDAGIESLLPPPSLVPEPIPEPIPVDEEEDVHEAPTLRPTPSQADAIEEVLPTPELDETEQVAPLSAMRSKSTHDLIRDATIGEGLAPMQEHVSDDLRDATIAASQPPTPSMVRARPDSTPPAAKSPGVSKPIDPNRPVVRVPSTGGRRVSLDRAPAARRSPKPLTTAGGDSLILPAERRGNWGVWLIVLAIVGAAIWFYVVNP